MAEEEIREGDVVTFGDSPTRWRAVREASGALKLVNIGSSETPEAFAARAKEALRKAKAAQRIG